MQNTRSRRPKNHPVKGSQIKVEPIRDVRSIAKIKALLRDNPRDLCLFTFGINTAYRAGEMLSLKVGQIDYLKAGDRLDLKQSKTQTYRAATLNKMAIKSIHNWLEHHPDLYPDAPLFRSQRTKQALTVSVVNHMVKRWCKEIDLKGNYGSHTMRKTWGYHQRITNNTPLPLISSAFGHTSQAQTLDYLCIQDHEIEELYGMEL